MKERTDYELPIDAVYFAVEEAGGYLENEVKNTQKMLGDKFEVKLIIKNETKILSIKKKQGEQAHEET